MKYIIVGTYKTNPESEGWYITNKRNYDFVWKKLSEICNRTLTSKDSYYDTDLKLGKIKDTNIYFYDLKKYNVNAGTTNDEIIFEKHRYDLIEGLEQLDKFLQKTNEEIKIGLQGNNIIGIVMSYYFDNQKLLDSEISLKKLRRPYSNKRKKDNKQVIYGLINKLQEVLPQNVSVYKIYNVSQQINNDRNLLNKTWDEFLKDCK